MIQSVLRLNVIIDNMVIFIFDCGSFLFHKKGSEHLEYLEESAGG
jgi:hypothetical protein